MLRKKYEIISENNIGVLLRSTQVLNKVQNICFVQHSSYEKYANKKSSNYGVKCSCKYIYIPKRQNNSTIIEHADNLINFLISNNINDVNLIAVSYGSLIAAIATKYSVIKNVVLFQAPLWGTPLADYKNWDKLNNHVSRYLKKRYSKDSINIYLDDLTIGLKDKWDGIKPEKITFIYGYSIKAKGLLSLYNRMYFYPEIKRISNMDNDAVVPFQKKEEIEKIGFAKVVYLKNIYHVCTILKKYHLMLLNEVKNRS